MEPSSTGAGLVVAFLNENALGHGSYLPRFVAELDRRPELGIRPVLVDVLPLPPRLQRRADFSLRGLRRFGLDFHVARWRRVASRHARDRLAELRHRRRLDAVVLNTQSIGLALERGHADLPTGVCLDATFAQLRREGWFCRNALGHAVAPITLAPILGPERRLFARAARLLAWSDRARTSLVDEYAVPAGKIEILPPSLDLRRFEVRPPPANPKRQVLFVGGDFFRKGGPILLEAYRRHLTADCELHLVTQSALAPEPGVFVHRGVTAGSAAWMERWRQAEVFVFPSALETFGIVLIEAMAFGVPVISSPAGVARDLLEGGRNGILLDPPDAAGLAAAVRRILDAPGDAAQRAARARERVERAFDLGRNTERLASLVRAIAAGRRT